MPRRRDPIKSRELSTELRDAQPTWHEIDGERDPRKRHERIARARSAREVLMRMGRDAEKRGSLHRLDPRVRNFIEGEKARNGGCLPEPKGGKPLGHRNNKRFLLAIKVHEAIKARGKKRGSVEGALNEVAERERVSYDRLREIYYDSDPRDVEIELSRRKHDDAPFSPALWFWEESSFLLFLCKPRGSEG
jgi:hypothetical protein